MLPKLHKSQQLSTIPLEYIQINKILDIEGRPIVAGSAYYTHGISILHKIMESSLKEISRIIKDTFSFDERTEKDLEIGTSSC